MERVPFDQAFEDKSGGLIKIKRRDYKEFGTLAVIDQGQAEIGGFTDELTAAYRGNLPVVLFGDHTRSIKLATSPFAVGADGLKVLAPRDGFDAEFLYHYLRSVQLPALGYSRHFKLLREITVPKLTLDEQRHIVDILNRANGILRLRREAQEKTRQLIPALFVKMFGDLRTNPHKWSIVRFSDLLACPLRNGASPSRRGRHQIRLLTLSAITRGRFDSEAVKIGMFDKPLRLKDQVSMEDFLICRGNGNLNLVGRGQFPNYSMTDVAFPDTIIASRPDTARIDSHFLEVIWNTEFLRKQIEAAARTTNGTFKINQTAIENFQLPLPSVDLQRAFGTYVSRFQSIAEQQSRMATTSERLVDSLMHRMFEGA